ncbi:MAG: glycogen debranching enzyme GlgX [Myxococcales bacterium]|nr:glycogen debranching enzyme GlgX [Myxococcales bacterium]
MVGSKRILEGKPYPLGAHWDGHGINFAVFSAHADAVEICIFDEQGQEEIDRIPLKENKHNIFYSYIKDLPVGTVYGLRVYGPYKPEQGHRFNHHKLLIDPYARQLIGSIKWDSALFAYVVGEDDLSFDTQDSAPFMPKAVVTAPLAKAKDLSHLQERSLTQGLIYETHLRGLSQLHPKVERSQQGSFSALANDAIVDHLKSLSVSAVELLPIQSFVNDHYLVEKGLSNYWGYQPIAYFAPQANYINSGKLEEIQQTIHTLADHQIEVLMDVVYNHTGEGNEWGPTLSFRGIDNASYYSLKPENPRYYLDDSGCGNRLNVAHPKVLQLVMDSLRYWHEQFGISGFRFDLCSTLGRGPRGLNMKGSFFSAISQDPTLTTARLIAEPWDIGPGGYKLGAYQPGWSEWNDRYRDTLRRFWRGDEGLRPELARRLCGSSALYRPNRRRPEASINYLCSHDGATLHDLVTYARKRNMANGEDNRDGHHDDLNIHCGVDGENQERSPLRRRIQRSLLTCLFLSRGAPMILAGDEMGRTQKGNNNAYCQDNPISWLSWTDHEQADESLLAFTQQLSALRQRFTLFSVNEWLEGEKNSSGDLKDLQWLTKQGTEFPHDAWQSGDGRDLFYTLADEQHILLVLMNSGDEPRSFTSPAILEEYSLENHRWSLLLDSAHATVENSPLSSVVLGPRENIEIQNKSVQVWKIDLH